MLPPSFPLIAAVVIVVVTAIETAAVVVVAVVAKSNAVDDAVVPFVQCALNQFEPDPFAAAAFADEGMAVRWMVCVSVCVYQHRMQQLVPFVVLLVPLMLVS